MDIVLVAGLWLQRSVWAEVADELESRGHRAVPVSLPGADDGSTTATFSDQINAVLAAVDRCDRPLVVGHSAACTLAWIAADRRPDAISGVVLIGGFPAPSGAPYADFFEPVDGVVAFPGWEPFAGPDSADLDEEARQQFESATVPVPSGVAKAPVHLSDERRFDVPAVLICPEFSPEQARGWIDGGHLPEMARAGRVTLVDIDTGHWPMITQPAELARILDEAASGG